MTDREYREIYRELDDRYRSQIESLRAQVQMLMDPLVQLKMLQPNPPLTFQLSDTETWNLAIEKAAQLMNPHNDEDTFGAMNAASIRRLRV